MLINLIFTKHLLSNQLHYLAVNTQMRQQLIKNFKNFNYFLIPRAFAFAQFSEYDLKCRCFENCLYFIYAVQFLNRCNKYLENENLSTFSTFIIQFRNSEVQIEGFSIFDFQLLSLCLPLLACFILSNCLVTRVKTQTQLPSYCYVN